MTDEYTGMKILKVNRLAYLFNSFIIRNDGVIKSTRLGPRGVGVDGFISLSVETHEDLLHGLHLQYNEKQIDGKSQFCIMLRNVHNQRHFVL